MDKALIVGILAFIFLIAFFIDNLKAARALSAAGPKMAKSNPLQRLVWKLTGSEDNFLFSLFMVEVVLLMLGGWITNGSKVAQPLTVNLWGAVYFGVLAAASIWDTVRH